MSTRPPRFKALVFDLDGTLVDSRPGIEACLRGALAATFPSLKMPPDLSPYLAPPFPRIVSHIWPALGPSDVGILVGEFRRRYCESGWRNFEIFPGAGAAVASLSQQGMRQFVLTNKPEELTRKILAACGMASAFEAAYSLDSFDPPAASKSEAAGFLLERTGLAAKEVCLVGDTPEDKAVAETCGMGFIGVSHGYGPSDWHPPTLLDKFDQLAEALTSYPL